MSLWRINVLDGGRDAPLSRRGLEIWHLVVAGVVLLGAVVLTVAYLNR